MGGVWSFFFPGRYKINGMVKIDFLQLDSVCSSFFFCLTSKVYRMLNCICFFVNHLLCHWFKCFRCGFSDIPHHLGRQVRRKARNGCAPIQLEVCRTLAASPLWFLLQLCLPLQLGNTIFPTQVTRINLLVSSTRK